MADPTSLRERKKQRTRRDLIEASQRLFLEQGYEHTTLEEICDEVEISVPTLLSYFTSKERLAFARDWDTYDEFEQKIRDPQRTETTVELWRSMVVRGATATQEQDKLLWRRYQTGEEPPALLRGRLALLTQYENLLAEGIAADFDTDPLTDLPTRLLASLLIYGHNTVHRHWAAGNSSDDLVSIVNAVVDFGVNQLPEPGSASISA